MKYILILSKAYRNIKLLIIIMIPLCMIASISSAAHEGVNHQNEIPQKIKKARYSLRSYPIKFSDKEGKTKFQLDELWRPLEYIENDFRDNGDGTITDHTTGLMWQKSGSDPLTYKQPQAYIKELNNKNFAGYNDWRLPTVDELKSLITKEKQSNGLYISPIFDKKQWRCCTSDIRNGSQYLCNVYFNTGAVLWYIFHEDGIYIRAVRSIK